MYRRIVFASTQGGSFADAAEALKELGELPLLPKRVWRAAKRIGEERVGECRAAAARYEKLSHELGRVAEVLFRLHADPRLRACSDVRVCGGDGRTQRQRMKYQAYRQQGLPITSSPIESTIKQINRRLKGTEKFWSEGADPMLHLVADRLSQTNVTDKFWHRRLHRLIQSASYQQAG
jgi:hypothetical protein